MNSRFWAILGIIAAVFIGYMVFKGGDSPTSSSSATPSSHIYGTATADVTLMEYGDFQCPYCSLFAPTLKQVKEKYKDQIAFQFRHYPLQQVHQNAFAASRAAEAAGMQNKFWEMHNQLYATQTQWKDTTSAQSVFSDYAKQLGLDVAKFKTDYASTKVNSTINADMKEFDKLKIRIATPTFLLDGKQIQPENSVESFSKLIDEALAKKQ